MIKRLEHLPSFAWIVLTILLLAAIAYLPYAHRFGYYNDDWYLIYGGVSQGSEVYKEIFAIDRPFRGVFVGWMFDLFGVNAPLYSYSAYLIRCLSALGLVWIARMVWHKERLAAVILGLIGAIYPGFLDQPNAIDFQSHIWAFGLGIGSVACSLRAMQGGSRGWQRAIWIALALLSQMLALLLMEYYIGLEGLRLLLILVMARRLNRNSRREQLRLALPPWLPSLAGALGFMLWRQLVFENQRGATDVGGMLTQLAGSPALEGAWMVVRMLQDMLNVLLTAWAVPMYTLAFSLRLKQALPVIGLAVLAALAGWVSLAVLDRQRSGSQPQTSSQCGETSLEMAWVGLLSVAAVLVPVHLGDRQVIFDGFSRFTLTGSIGAGLVVVAFWRAFLASSRLRLWFPAILVGLGVMTHAANGTHYANQWAVVRDFWWQISWRAPQIKPGTVVMVDYAGYGTAEDYFVWGPANLIYGMQSGGLSYPELPITAATLAEQDMTLAFRQGKGRIERRSFVSKKNFTNLLVLSMAQPSSCVHVLDRNGEVSDQARIEMIALAPYARMDRIAAQEEPRTPPAEIFGKEPAHRWCYYYQTASLLRQRGDWEAVARLGETVHAQDLRPYDRLEWLPFIQAYAYTGREERLSEWIPIVQEVPFLKLQACRLILNDPYHAAQEHAPGHEKLLNAFCVSGSD